MENIATIAACDSKSPVAEAYRTLRTNIKFAAIGKELKVLLLTSGVAGEGKSTTCSNLAAVIGQNGQKALIIDCDLRKPGQHKLFELEARGLSDCLAEGGDVLAFIQKTKLEGVEVLTAGTAVPYPAELLSSAAMEKLIRTVAEGYDYVLLDAPPVLPVPDALELCAYADGVIWVLCSGVETPQVAREVKTRLEHVGANIVCVVLNKVEKGSSYGYEYYYSSEEKED